MGRVEGEGIFQIPVGPIHAGIIEPGHFRFNVAGERIITLEGKLFFTHKGVEKLLEGRSIADAMPFVERVSGDAAASHALAFCQAVESDRRLPGPRAGPRAPRPGGRARAVHDAPARRREHLRDGHRLHGDGRERLPGRGAAAAAVVQDSSAIGSSGASSCPEGSRRR